MDSEEALCRPCGRDSPHPLATNPSRRQSRSPRAAVEPEDALRTQPTVSAVLLLVAGPGPTRGPRPGFEAEGNVACTVGGHGEWYLPSTASHVRPPPLQAQCAHGPDRTRRVVGGTGTCACADGWRERWCAPAAPSSLFSQQGALMPPSPFSPARTALNCSCIARQPTAAVQLARPGNAPPSPSLPCPVHLAPNPRSSHLSMQSSPFL